MFKPDNFFNMENFKYSDIFNNEKYVWNIIPKINEYFDKITDYEIESEIPDYVFLEGDKIKIGKNVKFEPGAYIKGPIIIGDNTEIRHGAYLRGNIIIGDNCVIGHASELKNVVMMNNSNIPHFNYVGDSIFGNNINIGAGVITANVVANTDIKKNIKIYADGEVIDTGIRKFGSILSDNVKIGCNSVLNPGTIVFKNTVVYPLSFVRGVVKGDQIIKTRQNQRSVEVNFS